MDIAQLKLDLVQRLLAYSDASFLEKLRALLLRKEQGESIRDQEIADMMAAANTFAVTAYSEDEPDISGITLLEPNPEYKPWKPGM